MHPPFPEYRLNHAKNHTTGNNSLKTNIMESPAKNHRSEKVDKRGHFHLWNCPFPQNIP